MEFREVKSRADRNVKILVAPGHFATNHSHINYYVDITGITSRHKMAQQVAAVLAENYNSTCVETIICLEGTEMIGAFLAQSLAEAHRKTVNNGMDICVITPELNSNNQMIFRENTQNMIYGKRVLLLIATASTGKTIGRAIDCLSYYSGQLAGICAVFSAIRKWEGVSVHSVFKDTDLEDYQTSKPKDCELCKEKIKLDAIVNSYGFSQL